MSSAHPAPHQPTPDLATEMDASAAHSAAGTLAGTGSVDAWMLLQTLPTAVLLVTAAGDGAGPVIRWLNEAARRLPSAAAGQLWSALWRQPAAALQALQAVDGDDPPLLDDCNGLPWRLRVQPQPDAGWLVSAESAGAERAARAQATHFSALLDLARGFGRLGVWERDMRTLEGRWDRQLLGIWGFDPDGPVPDYPAVISRVLPADLDGLNARFQASLTQAGRHAMRFRVRGPDGALRHLHSQWLVIEGDDGRPQRQIGLMMDDTEPFALARSASALESQLDLAAELAGLSVWRHDLATGRLHCGARAWQALGLEAVPDGLPADQARQLVHADDLPRVLDAARQALSGSLPLEVEARLRHAGGGWVLHVLRGNLLRDEAGEPLALIGVAMAASALLQQRRRAEEMAQRFDLVTDAAGIGYWLWEPDSGAPYWSARLRQIHGMSPDQAPPLTAAWLSTFLHPDDRDTVRTVIRALAHGRSQDAQVRYRIRRPDGVQRTLMSHAVLQERPEGPLLVGVVVDLTEQLRTEQALLEATERESLALHAAGMGVWHMEVGADGALWDAQMWLLRGRAPGPASVRIAEAYTMVHPDDQARMGSMWRPGVALPVTQEHEFRVVWPDGQVRWLASRSTERPDPVTGRAMRLGVNWDVTDRRNADQLRQERELVRREGEARSRFLARMSHELRTPLNAMLGYAQLLIAEPAVPAARTAERARHIATAGGHLLALINDVLELAGLEGGEWRVDRAPVALHQAVQEALMLVQPQIAERGLQLLPDLPPAHVLADVTRLRQVLLNLLSNAIKYNRAGGRLGLVIRHEAGPPARVVLAVQDDGAGLSDAQQQRLFEPFNRLGAELAGVQGHGIGLAIVKALVTRMQGEVRVHSSPGAGAVFELWLQPAPAPAVDHPSGADTGAAAGAAAAGGAAGGGDTAGVAGQVAGWPPSVQRGAGAGTQSARPVRQHRLLYVEDNPVNAQIMAELVALRGDVVLRLADTGHSGLQLAAAWQPELLLLDMHLPDMDGCSFMAQLQALPATAAVRCIAVSANAMPDDIRRALDAGAMAYWTKPLDFAAVLRALDSHFGPAPGRG